MLGEFGHGSSTFGSATVIQINNPVPVQLISAKTWFRD
jgi:hypothetical protein